MHCFGFGNILTRVPVFGRYLFVAFRCVVRSRWITGYSHDIGINYVLNFFLGCTKNDGKLSKFTPPEFVEKSVKLDFRSWGRRGPEPGFSDQGLESPFRPCEFQGVGVDPPKFFKRRGKKNPEKCVGKVLEDDPFAYASYWVGFW